MKRKFLIPALLVTALAAAGGGWFVYHGVKTAPTVTTVAVSRGAITQSVLATGMLEAQQLVSVGARTSGQIETLPVSLGQRVKAGDLIAQIDSQDQQNDLLKAQAAQAQIAAQIASNAADLTKAKLALARYEALGTQKLSSQETVESARADLATAEASGAALEAQKKSAEVNVAAAQLALDRTRITAPIDGTVVAVVMKQGQTVNATNTSPTIVKIADLDTMLVKVEISEADVVKVVPGQVASFTILGEPANTFDAVVQEIEPAPSEIEDSDTISSEEAIYYNGLLQVANPEGKLRIGMTAQVSIELGKVENVLTVPFSAIHTTNGKSTVTVYDAATGTTQSQPVEVGLTDKVTAEIRSGVSEGARVVITSASAGTATTTTRMRPPMGF